MGLSLAQRELLRRKIASDEFFTTLILSGLHSPAEGF
jgi:hypothetical protein